MNIPGINTVATANVVAPLNSVGTQAVGLENAEAKQDALAPIEEPTSNSAAFDREAGGNETEKSSTGEDDKRVAERRELEQQQQEQQQIRQLASRDREVRAHEQAHASVGGQHAGAPSFSFERGPDGVNYAVGGEVPISLPGGGGDPAATIAAAQQVRRAALAPAEPSPQDRSIAAQATQVVSQATAELADLTAKEQEASRAQSEQTRLETQREEEVRREEQSEQRLDNLRQAARRSVDLGGQLVTIDNVQRDQNVGGLVDQRA